MNYKFSKLDYIDYNDDFFYLMEQLTHAPSISKENFDEYVSKQNDFHQTLVLKDENNKKIIGSITVFIEQKLIRNYGKVGHIEDVVIDNEYRGKKLGALLIEKAVELCKNHNCYKVILDCDECNVKFYEKCNFYKKGSFMTLYM